MSVRIKHTSTMWLGGLRPLVIRMSIGLLVILHSGCHPGLMVGMIVIVNDHLEQLEQRDRDRRAALNPRPRLQAPQPRVRAVPAYRTPTPSQPQEEICERLLRRSADAYQQLHWNRAASTLTELRAQDCDDPTVKARGLILLGAITYQYGDLAGAKQHFYQASRLDPDAAPSTDMFPPHMVRFYNEVTQ